MVGRADELARVAGALSVPPAVVVVEGEAGIGKTRLVNEISTHPDLADQRVASGWCRRIREPFPLGPVIDAVRGLGPELAHATLSPVAGALRPLLPEVADLLPRRPDPLDDRTAERHRVFRGLTDVLSSLGPTILVLEDLHWADEQTVDFVSYLLGNPPPTLSLVVTFRAEEVSADLRELTARVPVTMGRARVVLAPLDETETGSLAAAILGTPRVPAEFATLLHQRTSGLPFAVEELVALLQERGALVRRDSDWARSCLAKLDVPAGVRDSVLARLRRLSDHGRSLVQAAAVLQTPVPVRLLMTTCPLPESLAPGAVAEAVGSGLLAGDDRTVGFRHLLAAQAVYEDMHALERQVRHAHAASALEAVRPVPLGQLAHHLRHAGRLDPWVEVAERAADQAVEVGHDEEAARLLEEVLRHAPLDADQQGRIAVKLGRIALDTVHAPWHVTDLLSQVLERDLPRGVRGELRFRLALLIGHTGADPRGGRSLLAEAIEDLDEDPDLRAWAVAAMAVRAVAEVPPLDPRAWLDRAMAIVSDVDDRIFTVFLLGKVAATMAIVGDPEWRLLAARIERLTSGSPRHRREVHAYYMVGIAACFAGHHEVAHRMMARARAGVAACDNRRLELLLESAATLLDYLRGSWQELPKSVERLIEEVADYPPARIDAELVAGALALAHGDLDRAGSRLSDALARAETLADFLFLPFGITMAINVTLARGDVQAAAALADRLLAAVPGDGIWPPLARALPAVARAMVGAGRTGEARRLVHTWANQWHGRDAPLAAAALAHANGHLDAADRRWSTAAQHLLAAADRYDSLELPHDGAQAREQAAICLFESGGGAEVALTAAMATYQRLGATWDLDRARSAARRHGVPAPNRHRGGRRGYGDDLSPREREVVELAARGRTNKEIAGELFLSPHTVDKHLRRALRKLGLRSRATLAHHLPAARPGSSD
jgi:DNA-binding CsgD family transcriptional regulator